MVKVKTSELTGAALDWAAAKCEGYFPAWVWETGPGALRLRKPYKKFSFFCSRQGTFSPSTNWSQGGPIIERESIWLTHHVAAKMHGAHKGDDVWFQKGPTPLIAAMRCHVASKLGDEVDVPEELL